MRRSLLALLMALPASFMPIAVRADSTVLLHARCVDLVEDRVEERSVWMVDGRVRALGAPDGSDLGEGAQDARRVDLGGDYLLPGLVDLRLRAGEQRSPGHRDRVGVEGTGRLSLAAGVALYVDLHRGPESALWRERVRDHGALSALPFAGGPIFAGPRSPGRKLPGALVIENPAEAVAAVGVPTTSYGVALFDRNGQPGGMDVEVLRALVDAARAKEWPLAVEVGDWRDVHDALDAGARWLVRVPAGEMSAPARARIQATLPRWTPTLAISHDFLALVKTDSLRADPLLQRLLPTELLVDYPVVRIPQSRVSQAGREAEQRRRSVAALDSMGVRWAPGSEGGALGTVFGWSLLRELEWIVEAGVRPSRALAAATIEAAPLVGETVGFVEGARADFVVLPRDPREDIAVLRELRSVIRQGEVVDPVEVADSVPHAVTVEKPSGPSLPGGRTSLFTAVVLGLGLMLALRGFVRRAAARALEDQE